MTLRYNKQNKKLQISYEDYKIMLEKSYDNMIYWSEKSFQIEYTDFQIYCKRPRRNFDYYLAACVRHQFLIEIPCKIAKGMLQWT